MNSKGRHTLRGVVGALVLTMIASCGGSAPDDDPFNQFISDNTHTELRTYPDTSSASCDAANIIMAVDASGSMQGDIDLVRSNLGSFVSELINSGKSFNLCFTSTEMDHPETCRGGIFTENDSVSAMQSAIPNIAPSGTTWRGTEIGLEALKKAHNTMAGVGLGDSPFMFYTSDEDDDLCPNSGSSPSGVPSGELSHLPTDPNTGNRYQCEDLKDDLESLNSRFFSVIETSGSSSCGADPNEAFEEMANRTNGSIFDFCSQDYSTILSELGQAAAGTPPNNIVLSRPADPNRPFELFLIINGARVEQEFGVDVTFDVASNSLTFHNTPASINCGNTVTLEATYTVVLGEE